MFFPGSTKRFQLITRSLALKAYPTQFAKRFSCARGPTIKAVLEKRLKGSAERSFSGLYMGNPGPRASMFAGLFPFQAVQLTLRRISCAILSHGARAMLAHVNAPSRRLVRDSGRVGIGVRVAPAPTALAAAAAFNLPNPALALVHDHVLGRVPSVLGFDANIDPVHEFELSSSLEFGDGSVGHDEVMFSPASSLDASICDTASSCIFREDSISDHDVNVGRCIHNYKLSDLVSLASFGSFDDLE